MSSSNDILSTTRPEDAPPSLQEMFINSVDTMQGRIYDQRIGEGWNNRPPLFVVRRPSRRRFWNRQAPPMEIVTEEENPNLLKGVSHGERKHAASTAATNMCVL